MSRGFSKAKKSKNFPMQEISIKFDYSRQQKMKDFSFQGRKRQIFAGGSDRFRFFYAFATVDVLPANNNDKNLDENRTVQFA